VENKQIKELMVAMERSGLTKLTLKKGSFELNLERAGGSGIPGNFDEEPVFYEDQTPFQKYPRRSSAPLPKSEAPPSFQSDDKSEKEVQGTFITSPMVGTYYSSPSPEDPAFVKVGDRIEKGEVLCIIEAMKVMNEVKAQVSGHVAEILIESGFPVEFGTKLFRIT
jgi:acetyl-CoA carboxylase biotin carboxyl carrier protein